MAIVGEKRIGRDAFEEELVRRGRVMLSTPEKAVVLEDLIRFEVLYQCALRDGFDKKPHIQTAWRNLLVSHYRQELAANEPAPTITDEEIAAYHRANATRYTIPEQVNVALILLPVSAKAEPEIRQTRLQHAENLRVQAIAEAANEFHFGMLAQTHSAHQASRYRGGELGWLTRESAASQWETVVVEAMFQLSQPREVSPVVFGSDGFYLLKLMDRRPASLRPLAEVREAIVQQLRKEHLQRQDAEMFARLKEGIPIRVNQSVLETIQSPDPALLNKPTLPTR